MNRFISSIVNEATTTTTENGDKTYTTSLNSFVDIFFMAGTLRQSPDSILNSFIVAYKENKELAIRLLLYIRDARGGMGERDVFHSACSWIRKNDPVVFSRLLEIMPEFGYFKDVIKYFDDGVCSATAVHVFANEITKGNRLAAKYAPRKGKNAARIAGVLKLTPKEYRKKIVALSDVVETKMCAKEWSDINYSSVPSIAMKTYSNAFERHDPEGFKTFIADVESGKEKVNAGVLYPYQCIKHSNRKVAEVQWKALPDYVNQVSFIPMIDVSESMTQQSSVSGITCMDAAISVGMYLMERNKTPFKNMGLTFSENPVWIIDSVQKSLHDRFDYIKKCQWSMSTNLVAAFDNILSHALNTKILQEDMPDYLIVLSDMEFNNSGRYNKSTFEVIKEKYEKHGYKLPNVIFWNLSNVGKSTPVRFHENGTALVSGLSPSIMTSVLGGDTTPKAIMLKAIMKPKYDVAKSIIN